MSWLFGNLWKIPGDLWKIPGDLWKIPGDLWKIPGDLWKIPGDLWKIPGELGKVPGEPGKIPGEPGKVPGRLLMLFGGRSDKLDKVLFDETSHLATHRAPLLLIVVSPRFLLAPALFCSAIAAHAAPLQFLDDEAEPSGYDVTATVSAPAQLALSRQSNGDGYTLQITPTALQLDVTQKGKTQMLARVANSEKAPWNLIAQRRGPRWDIIAGHRTVLRAENDAFNDGQIGFSGGIKEARVQPVEPITFDDDFMRVASDVALKDAISNPRNGIKISDAAITESIWTTLSGAWATTGLTENAEAQVAQSANPFAFRAMNKGENLAIAGRPFWSDVEFAVSVQPQGARDIGVLLDVSDAKNYLEFGWGEASDPILRAVIDGKTYVLGAAQGYGGFEQNQWTRLKFAAANGALHASIDDVEVVSAQSGWGGRGQIGLRAVLSEAGDDKKGLGAVFDDAQVRTTRDFRDDFSQSVPGRWTPIAGQWGWKDAAKPVGGEGAYAVTGESDWTDYTVSGALEVPVAGAAGLLSHHIAGQGAYLLRVGGSKSSVAAGRVQLARIAGGKTQVLAETEVGALYDGSNIEWELGDDNGYLSARADGQLVLDAFDETLKGGRAGVYGQGGNVDDFAVNFVKPRLTWAKVPELYEVEQQAATMGSWSTPQGFWLASGAGAGQTWEHKGEFWGNSEIRFPLPDVSGDKSAQLTLGSLIVKFAGGQVKVGEASGSTQEVKAGAMIEVARRGNWVIVRADDKVVLATNIK